MAWKPRSKVATESATDPWSIEDLRTDCSPLLMPFDIPLALNLGIDRSCGLIDGLPIAGWPNASGSNACPGECEHEELESWVEVLKCAAKPSGSTIVGVEDMSECLLRGRVSGMHGGSMAAGPDYLN